MLPSGLLGLVLASLGAAYMSTISTHLNWGSSYVVNDFYKQQINTKASEKELVNVGRLSTVVLMVASATFALFLNNAKQLFDIILMFGAGTGLIFILRWFWWRINAWSEITAMFSSGIVSILFNFTAVGAVLFGETNDLGEQIQGVFPGWTMFPIVVLITTVSWLAAALFTKPESDQKLRDFYTKIQPGGPGWKKVIKKANAENISIENKKQPWTVPAGILAMVVGAIFVYTTMFATGNWIYGKHTLALWLSAAALISGILLWFTWRKVKGKGKVFIEEDEFNEIDQTDDK
jgi:Na+/proline symporter